jgi:hypothetical protein
VGGAGATADAFAQFWAVYPRKVGKLDAEKAFDKALERTDAETLLAGARCYAGDRAGQDPKYTKHPTTWLNKDCWADETATANGPPIIDGITGEVVVASDDAGPQTALDYVLEAIKLPGVAW